MNYSRITSKINWSAYHKRTNPLFIVGVGIYNEKSIMK